MFRISFGEVLFYCCVFIAEMCIYTALCIGSSGTCTRPMFWSTFLLIATGRRLNTREKFKAANRVAQAIANVVSTCGIHTFKSRRSVLQELLKLWSQDLAITVLGSSLEEEEVDKDMDVAITEVDAKVDDDDVESDEEAAQEEEDDDTLRPTNDNAAVTADIKGMEVESEEEAVSDTAEHNNMTIIAATHNNIT